MPTLYLVGAGVRIPGQFTVEAIDALRRCEAVLTVLPAVAEAELLPSLGVEPRSLWNLYRPDRIRRESYDEISQVILDAAGNASPVGYVAQGSPIVFDSVTARLVDGARDRGWEVVVLPGVSSIDTVLVDVRHEPASGLQVFDTAAVVRGNIVLRSDIAALLLQPGAFATAYPALHLQDLADQLPALSRLRDQLLLSYAPNQECKLVRSSTSPATAGHIYRLVLSELSEVTAEALADTSLFIPVSESQAPQTPGGPGDRVNAVADSH